jgi:molybdate transport system substrate-binding protein
MRSSLRTFALKTIFGLAASAFISIASPVSAQTTNCTVVPSSATYDATIAVASNFYGPAQDLITSFTGTGKPGAGKHIRICQNATAVLNTEIRTGTSGYSLFLAANTTTPVGLQGTPYVQSGAMAKLYANGIPVLFALYATVNDVSILMPSLASGTWGSISYPNLSSDPLDTSASATVAVADPNAAPYGDAAFKIMNSMGLLLYPPIHTPLPGFLSSLYGNIDLTFQSVVSSPNNTSGFVSKAQICTGIGGSTPTYIYVQFTNVAYMLAQSGILIASGNSTQDGIGSDIFNYMLSNSSPTFWPDFLNDHCYGQISGSLFRTSGPDPKGQTLMTTARKPGAKPLPRP